MTARSLSTVDSNILRPQELPDSGIGTGLDSDAPSNNDHNYTLSPGLDAYLLNFLQASRASITLNFSKDLFVSLKWKRFVNEVFQTITIKASRF